MVAVNSRPWPTAQQTEKHLQLSREEAALLSQARSSPDGHALHAGAGVEGVIMGSGSPNTRSAGDTSLPFHSEAQTPLAHVP